MPDRAALERIEALLAPYEISHPISRLYRDLAEALAAVRALRAESQLDETDLCGLIAAELKHNDECGPGPVSEAEYLDDAQAILRIVREHER